MSDETSLRIIALRSEIASRLQPVCGDWPAATFEELVKQVAALTLKYEGHATLGMYDRRKIDRLVAEMKELLEKNERMRASG